MLNGIKSFSVYGLFGTSDVHIPFEENVKILIGENGLGKTQILNLFYYTLEGKFDKLTEYYFEKLELVFANGKQISLTKKEIEGSLFENPIVANIIESIGIRGFSELREIARNTSIRALINQPLFRQIDSDLYHSREIIQSLKIRLGDEDNSFARYLKNCKDDINNFLNDLDIMYFPTYRRVEEDLRKLGYDEETFHKDDDKLIHFGMDDVRNRFDEIELAINGYLKEGFSEMSSEILSHLIEENGVEDGRQLMDIEENDVEILLARVGKRLTESKKERIRKLLLDKEEKPKDSSLNFVLRKLIEIYSKQKEVDKSVQSFRDLCNKYLINKEVFYDESAIKIYIKLKEAEEEIHLSKLSSGEKQIISILSKIYLSDKDKRFIVLFDEPELSLSMTWQQRLLPDIFNSGKCDFLLAVTHSPFIFDNELDRYAVGLNEYIHPSNPVLA